jgi:hypothetical protein
VVLLLDMVLVSRSLAMDECDRHENLRGFFGSSERNILRTREK